VKNGKCVVESVDVLLDIKYIFPKWKNANSAPLSVQINWSAFWSELERHEFRHGEIAKKAANKLQIQLDQVVKNNGANCDNFGQLADAKLNSAVRRAAIEQHRFDRVEYMAFSKISRLQANLYQGR
jgi:predicted secreted Zn-dependent protease